MRFLHIKHSKKDTIISKGRKFLAGLPLSSQRKDRDWLGRLEETGRDWLGRQRDTGPDWLGRKRR